MSKIIRLIDRTRTVADWKCPRARYWGYEWGGRGIVKAGDSLPLFMGITLHDALAAIATLTLNSKDVDIDLLASTANAQMQQELLPDDGNPDDVEFAGEQAALVEGLIRGFYKHVWPRLMNQYDIVCTEEEMEWPLDDEGSFRFMTKPDLILEHKNSKELVYVEYKSTSSKKENWVNSWDTAVQLHSSIRATERSLDRPVSGVQIVGLYKGYESYGKQSSPFCYAYIRRGRPPFSEDEVSYSYKAGFKREATWTQPGGLKAWVDAMPENILADQFPMTPVIYPNDDLVEAFFRQRLHREREITDSTNFDGTVDLDKVFPQRFDQCQPSFGWGCQYKKICHGFVQDPLNEGFVLREPHHAQEREALGLDPAVDNGALENI
jgi:PD-(D/E)XK nuclease superfamily protein